MKEDVIELLLLAASRGSLVFAVRESLGEDDEMTKDELRVVTGAFNAIAALRACDDFEDDDEDDDNLRVVLTEAALRLGEGRLELP